MLRLLILATCICYVYPSSPNVLSCMPAGTEPKISDVSMTVTDCNNPDRCELIRNTTHNITITFNPSEDTEGLKMLVYGKVLRVRVPYIRNVDLCGNTTASDGTTCLQNGGLRTGHTYTLSYPFYIRSQFPEWKVPVEFELWDNNNVQLDCIRVQVEIKCNLITEQSCRRSA